MKKQEERGNNASSRACPKPSHQENADGYTPRALFINRDGTVYPDYLICSGRVDSILGRQPCPHSIDGRIPDPVPLDPASPTYSIDKGKPGDLCPPCAKQNLSHLGHWQGHGGQQFPEHLHSLRLFKCRQWFWLVVPGLFESSPDILGQQEEQ